MNHFPIFLPSKFFMWIYMALPKKPKSIPFSHSLRSLLSKFQRPRCNPVTALSSTRTWTRIDCPPLQWFSWVLFLAPCSASSCFCRSSVVGFFGEETPYQTQTGFLNFLHHISLAILVISSSLSVRDMVWSFVTTLGSICIGHYS